MQLLLLLLLLLQLPLLFLQEGSGPSFPRSLLVDRRGPRSARGKADVASEGVLTLLAALVRK